MAAYDGRNALALCALAAQADLDAEHGDVSSATQPIGEAENDATMKQRRLTIFTRILICSVILMIMSLIMMALGLVDLFMLGDGGTIDQARAYIILSLFAMSFSTSIWPIFMFKEGRKTNGEFKDMSTMFNGCRVLTLIWSIFTLILVGGAIVMPIISVAKRFPDGDKAEKSVFFEIIVIFICLTIGTLIFLISCPICCCPTVFGYTKYESHSREYWYDRSRELEQLKQEVAARDQREAYNRANMINEQHSGVVPSAPMIDDPRRPERGYRDERDFDNRGYHRGETRGRGRGRGRPPPRGERGRQDREHDGRDRERYRDHGEKVRGTGTETEKEAEMEKETGRGGGDVVVVVIVDAREDVDVAVDQLTDHWKIKNTRMNRLHMLKYLNKLLIMKPPRLMVILQITNVLRVVATLKIIIEVLLYLFIYMYMLLVYYQ